MNEMIPENKINLKFKIRFHYSCLISGLLLVRILFWSKACKDETEFNQFFIVQVS